MERLVGWWRRVLRGRGQGDAIARVATRAAERHRAASPAACASVVIPALNEAERVGTVIRQALADPATREVLVIDDSSTDDTAAQARDAGATVVTSTMLGKGASMRDGLAETLADLVVYLDGDLSGLSPGAVSALCRPLLDDEADFVKARFGRGGGRVTELTAKPMLKVFFPELAHFAQPLGGIMAARRHLLQTLEFEDDYGVDIGLLIDAQQAGARLAEVDIGSLEHDSQPLLDLAAMANDVSRVIYSRARAAGRLHVSHIASMFEAQRQATSSIDYILTRRRGRRRLLLLDMDGTVSPERFVQTLARATDREAELLGLLDRTDVTGETRSRRIAALFRFVSRRQFEAVARALVLRPGVETFVNRMRRAGFMVGLVSDSYFVAADIVRRRIFADFAIANTVQFEDGVCTGALRVNDAFTPVLPGGRPRACKRHVVERFRNHGLPDCFSDVWAVGDHVNDAGMLRAADRRFVIEPKTASLARETGATVIASFDELLPLVPGAEAAAVPQ